MNFNPYISIFSSVRASSCTKIHLGDYFSKYQKQVDHIRSIKDYAQRSKAKESVPAATMSGVFTGSGDKYLVEHSGLICIDVDRKDNQHIDDFVGLRIEFGTLPYVAYSGASISGVENGIMVLIPIAYPTLHELHFDALKTELAEKFNVKIDTAVRNVGAKRYVSYDSTPYFNWKAEAFEKIQKPVPTVVHDRGGYNLNATTLDDFNSKYDAAQIIEQHGWKHLYNRGHWSYYNRPGAANKTKIDGAIHQKKNFFIPFSESAGLEVKKCHSPFMLYTILEHKNDYSESFKRIKEVHISST